MNRLVVWSVVGIVAMPAAWAEEGKSSEKPRLEEVVVSAEQLEGPFLPDVVGAAIHAGKKTSVIDLQAIPTIVNNNYRQALAKTPSLLLSEETTPLFSVGYRGLEPHRAQFTQVLKDGIPIHAEMFGYPESYYTPPLQSIDHVDFVHGGAALMYGPQPGGALNFITKEPATDTPLAAYTENSFGDDQLFSTYTAVTGTLPSIGYRAYFHEREGNGFRVGNSDFEVIGSGLKVAVPLANDAKLTMTYDEYHEEHGEPGGLTKAVADSEGRDNTTRNHDRFRLERYYGTLRYEQPVGEEGQAEFRMFGGHYRRYSKRQDGNVFGGAPTGSTMSIEEQDFYTFGMEPRFRYTYDGFGGQDQTLTAGVLSYFSESPREDQQGTTLGADSGTLQNRSIRQMQYLSLFAEHLFRFDKLSLTPGVRLEHIWQDINELDNASKHARGTKFGDAEEFDFVPLFGVGATYDVTPETRLYANFSQGYRPKIFTQAVPTGAANVVNNDLEEGKSWMVDVGLRGKLAGAVSWDTSLFVMRFEDQIGSSGNTIENVGDARHVGLEFATEADITALYDRAHGTALRDRVGS
ncbi:MAG: TonB-dependent receptor, partial [Candidatus Omnitrophica bacterium]|nr:TonB-dependent receptor [Candidatus Omnitrophota bacterium]